MSTCHPTKPSSTEQRETYPKYNIATLIPEKLGEWMKIIKENLTHTPPP